MSNPMKCIIFLILFVFASTALQAKKLEFLEERTAYCHSEASLAKYLQLAKIRNINGMNQLVLDGECDFVPVGKIFSLTNYHKDKIGSMPVVRFSRGDQEMWTFQTFVQTTEFDSL